MLADASDGPVLWQTDMVTPAELSEGATGADVWSTPTFDARTNTLYVTTGNNFNPPVTPTAEAVVALDATTGAFRWVNQRYPSDVFPSPGTPQQDVDYDFGDSAKIYHLRDGRTVVGAGQKSGIYHVLDAESGALSISFRLSPAACSAACSRTPPITTASSSPMGSIGRATD